MSRRRLTAKGTQLIFEFGTEFDQPLEERELDEGANLVQAGRVVGQIDESAAFPRAKEFDRLLLNEHTPVLQTLSMGFITRYGNVKTFELTLWNWQGRAPAAHSNAWRWMLLRPGNGDTKIGPEKPNREATHSMFSLVQFMHPLVMWAGLGSGESKAESRTRNSAVHRTPRTAVHKPNLATAPPFRLKMLTEFPGRLVE